MGTELFLVIVYVLIFSFIFWKWKAVRGNAWRKEVVCAFFVLKVLVGLFYGWASPKMLNAPDALYFYDFSAVISNTLPEHPDLFLQLAILPRPDEVSAELYPYKNEIFVWNSLGSLTIVRVHAWMNLLSGNRYFVNIVLWNVLSTIGIVLLWRAFYPLVQSKKRANWLKAFLCLNPALLFWASGPHKEGISLFCIGVLSFFLSKPIKNWGENNLIKLRNSLTVLFCLCLLFQIRSYFFAAFILAAIVCISHCFFVKRIPHLFFLLVYGVGALAVFITDRLFNIGLLKPLVNFRNEFITITQGRSDFDLAIISADWFEVLKQLPAAFINPYLRPFLWDIIHFRSFIASAESIVLLLLLLFFTIRTKWMALDNGLAFVLIYFGIVSMLIIGFVVDNSGAIVRYRSVPYTLMLFAMGVCYLQNKRQVIL